MSEMATVALIAGVFNVAAVIAGRVWSRHEHHCTAEHIRQIHVEINSRMDDALKAKYEAGFIAGQLKERAEKVVKAFEKETNDNEKP